ncbi:MAG TPA: hypothetical protein VGB83_11130 [Actinomycetota bacterium]
MQEFLIEVTEEGRYEPMERRLKLSKLVGGGNKTTVEGTLVSVAMSRDDLIAIEEKAVDAAGVITIEVRVLDEAQAAEDFLDRITEPVEVTFEKRPKDDPEAEPVKETVTFRVPDPTGKIHWCVAGKKAATKDKPVEVDADGKAELVLDVWFDTWDPVKKKVVYDKEKVEFTHWTGPELDPKVFGPHPGDLPHEVAGPSNNRDRSRWQSKRRLPNEEFPAPLPIESHIRVRAWPKGKITREPYAIDAHERMLGETLVPLTLREAKVELKRTIPEKMPIPADGLEHDLEFEVTREGTKEKVRSARLSFDFAEKGHRGGSVEPQELTLTEDDDGLARLTYAAPELTYAPRESFTEELIAYTGSAEKRIEVGRFPLHLNPEISASITAEKYGLAFEPYELKIDAGKAPCEIRGVLELEVENRLRLTKGEAVRRFGIQHADVLITAGPDDVEVAQEMVTKADGRYTWKLDELAKGLAEHGKDRKVLELDRKTQVPVARFNDECKQVIDFYDEKVNDYGAWNLFDRDATLADNLRGHRLLFGEQLATLERDAVPKVLSGTALLRSGATFVTTYDRTYRDQFGRFASAIGTTFTEGVAFYLNYKDFADKAGAAVGGALGKLEGGSHWVVELLYKALDFLLTPLRYVSEQLVALGRGARRKLGPWLSSTLEGFKGTLNSIVAGIETMIARGRDDVAGIVAELINTLFNLIKFAVSLCLSCVLAFVRVAGGLLGTAGGFVGKEFSPQNFARLRDMFTHFSKTIPGAGQEPAGGLSGSFTIGKTIEWVVNTFVAWVTGKVGDVASDPRGFANVTVSAITETLDMMSFSARYNMSWLQQRVAGLNVPADAERKIDAFLADARDLNQGQMSVNTFEYETKIWAAAIDLGIIVVEGVTACLAILGSGGIMAGPVLAAFSKIETSFALLKTGVLGVVPAAVHGFYGFAVPFYYAGAIGDLAEA